MKLRSSDLQSDSDMDSTRNSCDVLIDASFPNAHFAFPKLFANCVAKWQIPFCRLLYQIIVLQIVKSDCFAV